MTGEHHVDDLIEVQQGEYRDACAHPDLVSRLIDACNILDTEATQSRTLTEGQLGTSVIRHIINGGTLDTYPDH